MSGYRSPPNGEPLPDPPRQPRGAQKLVLIAALSFVAVGTLVLLVSARFWAFESPSTRATGVALIFTILFVAMRIWMSHALVAGGSRRTRRRRRAR